MPLIIENTEREPPDVEELRRNIVDFTKTLTAAGYRVHEPVKVTEADETGQVRPARLDGPGDSPRQKAGFYFFNGRAGYFGTWRDRTADRRWTATGDGGDTETFDRWSQAADANKPRQNAAALKAWNEALPVVAHGYLAAKGVQAHGCRVDAAGNLLVPFYDADGLRTLLSITPDGTKRWYKGTNCDGAMFRIGSSLRAPGNKAYVAEGFATGAAIHEVTHDPVFVAGCVDNLEAAARAVQHDYPDAKLIIAADNDGRKPQNNGLRAALQAGRELGLPVAAPQFADAKGTGTDFNDLHQAEGAAAVLASLEAAVVPAYREPDPLRRDPEAPRPFPVAALGPLQAVVQKAADVIGCDIAVVAGAFLASAAVVAQRLADVVIDGRCYPLSLYFLSVAESGDRKSEADKQATRPLRERQKELYAAYQEATAAHSIAVEAWTLTKAAVTRDAKQSGADAKTITEQLAAAGTEPEPPLTPALLVSDPNYEGVFRALKTGQPAIGVFSDEGGSFFSGWAMREGRALHTIAKFTQLYDGSPLDKLRGGTEALELLYGRRLSLHLMMQPVVADKLLQDPEITGQGFLWRCLLTWPKSRGFREYTAADLNDAPEYQAYCARLRELLDVPLPLATGTRNELSPRPLPLSADAKKIWLVIYEGVERGREDGGDYADIRQFASKAPEHVLRIAGVLTLYKDPNAAEIDYPELAAAGNLVAYYLAELRRIIGCREDNREIETAEKLLNWIYGTGRDFLSLRHIYRNCVPTAIQTKKSAMPYCRLLEQHGYLIPIKGGMTLPEGTGGQPIFCREVFMVRKNEYRKYTDNTDNTDKH